MHRLSLLLALALTLLPGFVGAQWKATKLPDGSYECRNADGRVPASKYTGSAATIFCNGVGGGWTWFGTAEAQQTGIFKARFPTGINVGSGPPLAPSLSLPWTQTDIGSPPVAGNAFDSQGVLTLSGSGDFHQATGAYHFVKQPLTGDWQLDFNLTSLTGAGQYRDCGPAFVDALASDTKYVYLSPSIATGKAHFGVRSTTGAGVYETQTLSTSNFSTGPMRITKIGSVWTGFISTDAGMTYELVGSGSWTPSGTFQGGIHVDSGESLTLATCQGTNWKLTSLSSSGPGTVSFITSAVTVSEAVGTTQICTQRAVDTSGGITIDVQNAGGGSAAAGVDFTNIFPSTHGYANGIGGQACSTLVITNRAGTQGSRTLNLALGNATGGVTIGSPSTMTVTITDSSAMKTQPGWYAMYDKGCIKWDGVRYGCQKSELVNIVGTEVCPNANIVGVKMIAYMSFLVGDTPGTYTGTNPDFGYEVFDAVLQALHACNKYLIIQTLSQVVGVTNVPHSFWPAFTFPSSGCGLDDCIGGTGSAGAYGIVRATQASQGGQVARWWNNDWRDLAISTIQAYCTRYETDPSFYAVGIGYWNTSLPINAPFPAGYDEATFNNQYRTYLTAARTACPTTNLLATLDYADPNPAQMSTWLAHLQTTKGSVANTDVNLRDGMTWGQQTFTGYNGSPSVIDYRGVVRYMEEVESPDMCGSLGNHTPAELFNVMQNGDAANGTYVGNRARWPTHIVIDMATSCPPGYDWNAWKTFIAGKSGQVMDGHGPTLRTPAYVKANACESSQTCQ
jgi:hypothetical protein